MKIFKFKFILFLIFFSNLFLFALSQTKNEIKQWEKLQKEIIKIENAEKQVQILQDFVDNNPDHYFLKEVKARIAEIFFKETEKKNSIDAYENFMEKFPESDCMLKAKEKLTKLAYQEAKKIDTIKAYEDFLLKFPDSESAHEAREEIKALTKLAEFKLINKSELDKLILAGNSRAIATSIGFMLNPRGNDVMADLIKGEWNGSYNFTLNNKSYNYSIKIAASVDKDNIIIQYFDKDGKGIEILTEEIKNYYIYMKKVLLEIVYGKISIKSGEIELGVNLNFNMQELITAVVKLEKKQ